MAKCRPRSILAKLSEQFDASRAAVRNALVQLTTEGLVERIQSRGARVRAVSLEEAIEITEVRMVVEGLCAARAAEGATDEDKTELHEIGEQMRAAVSGGDVWGYSELNKRLHSLVLRVSGQETAHEVLSRLRGQNVRHQFRLAMHPGRPTASLPQHLAIIEAICAADPAAAEQAMHRTCHQTPAGLGPVRAVAVCVVANAKCHHGWCAVCSGYGEAVEL